MKNLGKPLVVLMISLLSGAGGGALVFSYLSGVAPFNYNTGESVAPVRITEKEETVIQENKALKEAAAKVMGVAVGIKITTSQGAVANGSGVIFTSDGMVAVPYSLFPPGASAQVAAGDKIASFEVVKRDKAQNLVILKLGGSHWPTAGFYQLENLKLGERIFMVGMLAGGGNFVNEGVVRDFTSEIINTNIQEKAEAAGSPVFDIEGNILGIAVIDKMGNASVIPISKIKELVEL